MSAHQQLTPSAREKLCFTATATGTYGEAAAVAAKWGLAVEDSTIHQLVQQVGEEGHALRLRQRREGGVVVPGVVGAQLRRGLQAAEQDADPPLLQPGDNLRQAGAGEPHDVGAPQSGRRFAQQSAGEQVFVAERLERVEQHDIQIATQATMLEAVVEQYQIRAEFADRSPRCGSAWRGATSAR